MNVACGWYSCTCVSDDDGVAAAGNIAHIRSHDVFHDMFHSSAYDIIIRPRLPVKTVELRNHIFLRLCVTLCCLFKRQVKPALLDSDRS